MTTEKIKVIIDADTKGLNSGLTRARANLRKFAKVGVAAFAAVGVAIVALTKRSLANIDALAKQARSLGLTVRALQAMNLVADEAGISTGKLTQSLGFMQRNIIELGKGTKLQVDSFKRLNLTYEDMAALSPDQQFEKIAVALNGITDPAIKTATAMDLFGRGGRDMINMFSDYSSKVAEATAFQKKFNIAVSDEGAAKIERANDAVGRIKSAFVGLGNVIAINAAPYLETFANWMGTLSEKIPGLISWLKELAPTFSVIGSIARTVATGVMGLVGALNDLVIGIQEVMDNSNPSGNALVGFFNDAKKAADDFGFTAENIFGKKIAKMMGATIAPRPFTDLLRTADGTNRQGPFPFDTPLIDPLPDYLAGSDANSTGGGGGGGGTGGGGGGTGSGTGGGGIGGAMADRLETLMDGLMSEREVLTAWREEGQLLLAEALDKEKITTEEHKDAMLRLEEEYQSRLSQIKEAGQKADLSGVLKGGATVLGAMGSFNKKALKLSQAFAAADALVSTFQGAAKELAKGTLGFPMAAAVIAKGLAFVGAIKGISSSGGGGIGGGGASASPAAPQISRNVVIELNGSGPIGMDQVRELINSINIAVEDGAIIRAA